RFTILNDPLPMVNVEAQASAGEFGPLTVRGRFNRVSNQVSMGVDFTDLPIGASTQALAARYVPDIAPVLAKLMAHAQINADVRYPPGTAASLHHEVKLTIKQGTFTDPELPWTLEKIEGSARVVDGSWKIDKATAQAGPVALEVTLETRDP